MTTGLSIGLDFGTDSARALVLDVDSGREVAVFAEGYPRGVLVERLPDGTPLPPEWALQHPMDYLQVAESLLSRAAASDAGDIVGIGISFTSCTILPVSIDGTPLVFDDVLAAEPHTYVKLWKHHAAAPYARRITDSQPYFLGQYGGQTSPEWSLAKAWELMDQAPHVWDATRWWIDAGDWMVWQLVGEQVRSRSHAGCKNHYQPMWDGYPSAASLRAIDPVLDSWLDRLAPPRPVGTISGGLARAWADRTGIASGVPVAVSVVDAEAALPGADVRRPGAIVLVLGTSTCHLTLSEHARPLAGIESVVDGAAIEGYFDYCTGQPATGDMMKWWVRMLTQGGAVDEATVLQRLSEDLQSRTLPSGLRVLDWWNGSRTPLGDSSLSGRIEGLRLSTTPGDIYYGMIEATGCGSRLAAELLEQACGHTAEVRATGGLAQVPSIMQVYADIFDRDIHVTETHHGSARGAAYYGAIVAGIEPAERPSYSTYSPSPRAQHYSEVYEAYLAQVRQMATARG
jgi:L-ribulokinase